MIQGTDVAQQMVVWILNITLLYDVKCVNLLSVHSTSLMTQSAEDLPHAKPRNSWQLDGTVKCQCNRYQFKIT